MTLPKKKRNYACEVMTRVRAGYKGTWLNRYDTDSPLCVRLIASARIIEMSIT